MIICEFCRRAWATTEVGGEAACAECQEDQAPPTVPATDAYEKAAPTDKTC